MVPLIVVRARWGIKLGEDVGNGVLLISDLSRLPPSATAPQEPEFQDPGI